MTPDIAALTRHPLLWRGGQAAHRINTLASGHTALDAILPGHGWPLGAVTELIYDTPGCGELSLVLPALVQLHRAKKRQVKKRQDQQRIVMIDPPWIPYPPALQYRGLALDDLFLIRTKNRKESLWACTQVLRGMPGGAMLAWPEQLSFSELRCLQLAAEKSRKAVFLFSTATAANNASPAALRLQLTADDGDLQIRVLKCRGQRPTAVIRIRRTQVKHAETQLFMPPLVSSSGSSKRSKSASESPVISLATSRTDRPSL